MQIHTSWILASQYEDAFILLVDKSNTSMGYNVHNQRHLLKLSARVLISADSNGGIKDRCLISRIKINISFVSLENCVFINQKEDNASQLRITNRT